MASSATLGGAIVTMDMASVVATHNRLAAKLAAA